MVGLIGNFSFSVVTGLFVYRSATALWKCCELKTEAKHLNAAGTAITVNGNYYAYRDISTTSVGAVN